MDSFKFHDIRVEKANAISRYRKMQRITTLFRFIELFVFLIIVSRFSTQFAFSFSPSAKYFRGISISPVSHRFVFVLGNAIVIALFLISGQFSAKNGGNRTDFYAEYVEKCRLNQQAYSVSSGEKIRMCRSRSENFSEVPECRRELRRIVTERCRSGKADCGRKVAVEGRSSSYKEDEMSGEEFRRTVEAFIARQQKCLREEEEEPSTAVVSL